MAAPAVSAMTVSLTVPVGNGAGGSKMARSARMDPPASTPKTNVSAIWNSGPRMNRFNPAPRATRKVATMTNVCRPIGLPQNESSRYPSTNASETPRTMCTSCATPR